MAEMRALWVVVGALALIGSNGCRRDDDSARGSTGGTEGGGSPTSGGADVRSGGSGTQGGAQGDAGGSGTGGGRSGGSGGNGNASSGGSGNVGGADGGSGGSGGNATSGGSGNAGGAEAGSGGAGGSGGNANSAGSGNVGGAEGGSGGSGDTGGSGGNSGGAAGGGAGPSLEGCPIFPPDNPWNTDVSGYPLHPNSEALIDSIGRHTGMHADFGTEWQGAPIGIPFVLVDSSTPAVPIDYTSWGDESDPGPFPIPPDAPIEGGPDSDGDRHVLVIDTDHCVLYEIGNAYPIDEGASWEAGAGVEWDLTINDTHPEGCTSADAAGLPIFPGLARYDEIVTQGELTHALRFTVSSTRRAYIPPASHYASSNTDANLPPMGLRVRMKRGYDCSSYSTEIQVICAGLKRYGMIVADNGSDWYVSGAPDPRWNDDALHDIDNITGDAFEVVDTGEAVTNAPDCQL